MQNFVLAALKRKSKKRNYHNKWGFFFTVFRVIYTVLEINAISMNTKQ